MPPLDQHQSTKAIKLLLVGTSGSGKTGALASLAAAGYRLFIADFDNGLDVLMDPLVLKPEFRKNIYFKTLTDKMKGAVPDGPCTAIRKYQDCLNGWVEGEGAEAVNMGSIFTWGEKDVFVTDSITFMGNAALRFVLQLAGRATGPAQIQDWGAAMDIQESAFETLFSDAVKCNIIFTAHMVMLKDTSQPGDIEKLYPSALGKKLPPKVATYFNTVIQAEKQIIGGQVKRFFKTQATFQMDLKVSKPSVVPPVMEADLGKLFALLKG